MARWGDGVCVCMRLERLELGWGWVEGGRRGEGEGDWERETGRLGGGRSDRLGVGG